MSRGMGPTTPRIQTSEPPRVNRQTAGPGFAFTVTDSIPAQSSRGLAGSGWARAGSSISARPNKAMAPPRTMALLPARMIVGGFARHGHIVNMALAQAGAGD